MCPRLQESLGLFLIHSIAINGLDFSLSTFSYLSLLFTFDINIAFVVQAFV